MYSLCLPIHSIHLATDWAGPSSAVASSRSRRVRSGLPRSLLSPFLRLSSRGQWSMMCAAVSRAPQLQFGDAMPGTRHWKRNAFSPIFPVRICTSAALSCFRRVLCFCSVFFVNSGLSAGSCRLRSGPSAAIAAFHRASQSRCTASVVDPSAAHRLAHSCRASPLLGSCLANLGLPRLFRSRRAIAAQALRIISPFFVVFSRASKSARRLLR